MFKALDKWFPGYLSSVLCRPGSFAGTRHLIVAVCDHFEPFRGGTATPEARRIVREWTDAYPQAVEGFRDADGCPPRHTFFYPEEEYDEQILDLLADFCRKGFGEVEIHLHHRHDTVDGLRSKLERFRDLLHERHGLLGVASETTDPPSPRLRRACHRLQTLDQERERLNHKGHEVPEGEGGLPAMAAPQMQQAGRGEGEIVPAKSNVHGLKSVVSYGFIHGNWALCNSRPDGDWCGVNEELGVLAGTGCYADFTFPSLPSATQPRMVNAIYYAKDTPGRPRGADRGVRVGMTDHRHQTSDIRQESGGQRAVTPESADSKSMWEGLNLSPSSEVCGLMSDVSQLMLITGPVGLNWRRRKWGVLPRVENGEISGANPPTAERVRLWVKQWIGVRGRPDWVFVKLHTHGCVPENSRVLLGEKMRVMHETLQREFNDGKRWQLHYVTAREMYNLVKAAEAGMGGVPSRWRDWLVGRPFAGRREEEENH